MLSLHGILVANVTPFTPDLQIDEEGLRSLMRYFLGVKGLGGVVCNAHAGEGATMNRQERQRCLRIIAAEVKGRLPIVAGVEAIATQEVVTLACDAEELGADAVMVCPPPIFAWTASRSPEFALEFHRAIAKAVRIPLVLFQYSRGPLVYDTATLVRLAQEIDSVVAAKMAIGWDITSYEAAVRALRALPRRIALLPTASHKIYCYLAGGDGSVTGFANFAATETVQLFEAVKRGEIATAKALQDRLYPVASIVYGDPYVYLHTRYKEATCLIGRIKHSHVRPPQLPMPADERQRLQQALLQAGLLAGQP